MRVGEIIGQCEELHGALAGALVEVTGGEPLEQEACGTLAECLLERGATVLVETSGTLPIGTLPAGAIRIMDIKCPGSGVSDKNDWSNIALLTKRDEVKFVIGDRADYEWSKEAADRHRLAPRCRQVLFAPVFGKIAPRVLADWILEDGLDVRLQLQLHKVIWSPDRRGV